MNNTGILVLAQNSALSDYVLQSCLLAMSVKVTNPSISVSIVTNDTVPAEYVLLFDKIIPIPLDDDAVDAEWKIENRWKLYNASPYDNTIVMDTDMLVLQDLSSWLVYLSNYEVHFTSNVYTYRNELVTSDFYRKTFTSNNLPNLYSGFHYFKKCKFASEFYAWLEIVVTNWQVFYAQYLPNNQPKQCSIDVCAAIVAKILDCDSAITNATSKFPSFTHMKPAIQEWTTSYPSWQQCVGTYIADDCSIKIGNYAQTGILHYTESTFVDLHSIVNTYRRFLDV